MYWHICNMHLIKYNITMIVAKIAFYRYFSILYFSAKGIFWWQQLKHIRIVAPKLLRASCIITIKLVKMSLDCSIDAFFSFLLFSLVFFCCCSRLIWQLSLLKHRSNNVKSWLIKERDTSHSLDSFSLCFCIKFFSTNLFNRKKNQWYHFVKFSAKIFNFL